MQFYLFHNLFHTLFYFLSKYTYGIKDQPSFYFFFTFQMSLLSQSKKSCRTKDLKRSTLKVGLSPLSLIHVVSRGAQRHVNNTKIRS